MASTFQVNIITPEKTFFSGEAVSLIAPGELGYLGILANHAPLATPLKDGRITLRLTEREEKQYEMDRGFLEVSNNQVLLLVEKIEEVAPESV